MRGGHSRAYTRRDGCASTHHDGIGIDFQSAAQQSFVPYTKANRDSLVDELICPVGIGARRETTSVGGVVTKFDTVGVFFRALDFGERAPDVIVLSAEFDCA